MNILIVEDEVPKLLERAFADGDYEIRTAITLKEAETLLSSFWPDFVVLDANFPTNSPDEDPEFNADGLLTLLATRRMQPTVILVSGDDESARHFPEVSDWLRTERISDVLPKSGAWEFFRAVVRHRVELLRRNRFLVESTEDRKAQDWLLNNNIVTREPSILALAGQVQNIVHRTDNNWTILILGPTGSGKDLLAKAISKEMAVKAGRALPFVRCHCGSFPPTLAETELLGSIKGAFFDAKDRAGYLEQANDGLLFIDDVHWLSPEMQSTLLQALDNRQFRRLGDVKDRPFKARVAVSTNADLGDSTGGGMTEEFYHRVAQMPLVVPPLSQRQRDIEPLVMHFACRLGGGKPCEFEPAVIEAFRRYSWPGNVRELEDIIKQIHIAVSERLVTMPILRTLNLKYRNKNINWDLPVSTFCGGGNDEDSLLLKFGWSTGWRGLKEALIGKNNNRNASSSVGAEESESRGDSVSRQSVVGERLKAWLQQTLPPGQAALIDGVVRKLDARVGPVPKAYHYLKAWLFLALTRGQKADHKQLMKVLDLEWDYTNRIALFLGGIKGNKVPDPLETPVIARTLEGGRYVYTANLE